MRSQTVLSILVVSLVITAGCATVPATESPPGIAEGEVTDSTRLVRAHTDALENRTFTVRSTTTMRGIERDFQVTINRTWRINSTNTVRGKVVRTTTTAGNPPERYTQAPDKVVAWRNGTNTTQRTQTETGIRYQSIDLFNSPVKLNTALQRKTIYRLTTRSNATVDRVSRNGEPLYLVSADLNDTHVTTNASMTLLVDSDGLVHEIQTAQTVRYRSGPRRIIKHVRIVDVGTTNVDRPEWAGGR